MDKTNHGLPATLENGWKLRAVKPNEMMETDGLTEEDVQANYGTATETVVNLYYYESPDREAFSARIGVEYSSGRLAVYGCHSDIDDCKTDENFVAELTNPCYNQ